MFYVLHFIFIKVLHALGNSGSVQLFTKYNILGACLLGKYGKTILCIIGMSKISLLCLVESIRKRVISNDIIICYLSSSIMSSIKL